MFADYYGYSHYRDIVEKDLEFIIDVRSVFKLFDLIPKSIQDTHHGDQFTENIEHSMYQSTSFYGAARPTTKGNSEKFRMTPCYHLLQLTDYTIKQSST